MNTRDMLLHALWGVVLLLIGLVLTGMLESSRQLSIEFSSFKYHVAQEYTPKQDLQRLETKIDKLNDTLVQIYKEDLRK